MACLINIIMKDIDKVVFEEFTVLRQAILCNLFECHTF